MIISDLTVFLHLFLFAIGVGFSARLELRIFSKRHDILSQTDLDDLHFSHNIIALALLGLWFTGTALIGLRTGFQLENFSPKLWSKVMIVTLLTLNALIIKFCVLPIIEKHRNIPLSSIPTRRKIPMAICAAISSMCWLTALALGSSGFLKEQPWHILRPLFLGEFTLGICLAILGAFLFRAQGK